MKYFSAYFLGFLILLAGNAAAQSSGAVRIYTIPDGREYSVDGVRYTSASSYLWLAGSKHVLNTDRERIYASAKTLYRFVSWRYAAGTLATTPEVTISADPSLKEFWATYEVQHALSLNFSPCDGIPDCSPSGKVYVNGQVYTSDADIYFSTNSSVVVKAEPMPGYVFAGWDQPGGNQAITGFLNVVTLSEPTVVRPRFLLARHINLATEPAELQILADRAPVRTPITLDWAYGSTHTLGAPSPQQDKYGQYWLFSRWSDDAPENRTYTVQPGGVAETFTAIFVPGNSTDLRTSPSGLKLIVDGRDNWPRYIFPWGAGETHRIEAPEQQTDAQGRLWRFASWSNGGARAQDYTVPAGEQAQTLRLTAVYTAIGHLTVTSEVSGLTIQVDGADCATPCDVQRPVGTVVRLSAPASLALGDHSRADFEGWPGSGSLAPEWSLTLTADPITPRLTYRPMYRLIAAANPAGGASWRMHPASPDGFYDAQSTVTVTALAEPGFRFRRWSGDASGSAAATSVVMTAPRLVEAVMDRIPYVSPAGVSNAAGAPAEQGVAPGSIVSIFGASFSPETLVGPENPLSQALGCVTVRLNGRLLPLFFVSPSQINLQMPEDTPIGEQRLIVSCTGLPDVEAPVSVKQNAPGLFAGAVLHEDGSLVTAEAPAKRGELLTMYGTGFGPAERPRAFGLALSEASPILDPVSVAAGEAAIMPERSFAAAGKVGLDAVQFRLPDSAPAGTIQVRVIVNGKESNSVPVAAQ